VPEWSRAASAWEPGDVPSFTGDARDRTLALLQEALRTDEAATALLASLQAHVAALALVAEAVRRGAVVLPPGVAQAVSVARGIVPDFLRGAAPRPPARPAAASMSDVLWAPQRAHATPD
jgi:hypothetical protein